MNYFESSLSLEEGKNKYRRLAFEHHPDKGGDVEIMKQVNVQYENFLKVKSKSAPQEFKTWSNDNSEFMHRHKFTDEEINILIKTYAASMSAAFSLWLMYRYKK